MEGKSDPYISTNPSANITEAEKGRQGEPPSFIEAQRTLTETRAEQQEGNYASSASFASHDFPGDFACAPPSREDSSSPWLGAKGRRMCHFDLGLTLLPGLQVKQVETNKDSDGRVSKASEAEAETTRDSEADVGDEEILGGHEYNGVSKLVVQDGGEPGAEFSGRAGPSLKDAEDSMRVLQDGRNLSCEERDGAGPELDTDRCNDARPGTEESICNISTASFRESYPRVEKRKREGEDVVKDLATYNRRPRMLLNAVDVVTAFSTVHGGTQSKSGIHLDTTLNSSHLVTRVKALACDTQHLHLSQKTNVILCNLPKLIHLFNSPIPFCDLYVESTTPSILSVELAKLCAKELLPSQHSSKRYSSQIFTRLAEDLVSSTAIPDVSIYLTQDLLPLLTTPEVGQSTLQKLSTTGFTDAMPRRQIKVFDPTDKKTAPGVDRSQNVDPQPDIDKPRAGVYYNNAVDQHNTPQRGTFSPVLQSDPPGLGYVQQTRQHTNFPTGYPNVAPGHHAPRASRNALSATRIQTAPQPQSSPPQPRFLPVQHQRQFSNTHPQVPGYQLQHAHNNGQHTDQALLQRLVAERDMLYKDNMDLRMATSVQNRAQTDPNREVRVGELIGGYTALHKAHTRQIEVITDQNAKIVELHKKITELENANKKAQKTLKDRERAYEETLKTFKPPEIHTYMAHFDSPTDKTAYSAEIFREQVGAMKKTAENQLQELMQRPLPPVANVQTIVGNAGYGALVKGMEPNGGPYGSPYEVPRKVSGTKRAAPRTKPVSVKKRKSTTSKAAASTGSTKRVDPNAMLPEPNAGMLPDVSTDTGNKSFWSEDMPMFISEEAQSAGMTSTQGNPESASMISTQQNVQSVGMTSNQSNAAAMSNGSCNGVHTSGNQQQDKSLAVTTGYQPQDQLSAISSGFQPKDSLSTVSSRYQRHENSSPVSPVYLNYTDIVPVGHIAVPTKNGTLLVCLKEDEDRNVTIQNCVAAADEFMETAKSNQANQDISMNPPVSSKLVDAAQKEQDLSLSLSASAYVNENLSPANAAAFMVNILGNKFSDSFVESAPMHRESSSAVPEQCANGPFAPSNKSFSENANSNDTPAEIVAPAKIVAPAETTAAPKSLHQTFSGNINVDPAAKKSPQATSSKDNNVGGAASGSPISLDSGYGASPNMPTFRHFSAPGASSDESNMLGPQLSPRSIMNLFDGNGRVNSSNGSTSEEQGGLRAVDSGYLLYSKCKPHGWEGCPDCLKEAGWVPNDPPLLWEAGEYSTVSMVNGLEKTSSAPMWLGQTNEINQPGADSITTANTTMTKHPQSDVDRILANLTGSSTASNPGFGGEFTGGNQGMEDLSGEYLGSGQLIQDLLGAADTDNFDYDNFFANDANNYQFGSGNEHFNFDANYGFGNEFGSGNELH